MVFIFWLLLILLVGYFFYLSFDARPGVRKIESFRQALKILNIADSKTLVLFDVDDTLIMPASKIFRPSIQEKNKEWINEMMMNAFKRAKKTDSFYIDLWLLKEIPDVIEPDIIEIIKALQDRGVIVLALTTTGTGSSQLIPSIPEWRLSTLRKVGIDFDRTDMPNMIFNELPKDNEGNYPILYHGMLLCNSVSKGIVLGAFLNHIKWKPDKIIFFDNNPEYVKAVAQEAEERKISFYGYEYLGAQNSSDSLNKEIAELQINHLVDNEEWLTEQETQTILKNKN